MRVGVVGGGLAGLAAACNLAKAGHAVTVFERRPWCGGKTYSHRDPDTGEEIDNGQHVFMACTTAYIDFLRELGTLKLTKRQKRLWVRVYNAEGKRHDLRADGLPAPGHLGRSFARYGHLSLRQRLRIAPALLAAARMTETERRALDDTSLEDWLLARGQDDATIRDFWDFMLIPTLNCRASECAAADALFVLRHGFLHSNSNASIGVSAVGLSELHVRPAEEYLRARGGEVRTGTTVTRIVTGSGRVRGVEIEGGGGFEAFDAVVCALPAKQSLAVLPEEMEEGGILDDLRAVRTAPIINLHAWFDRPVMEAPFAAFVGNELQWVFNRDMLDRDDQARHHVVVSLSAAQEYMPLTKQQLEERFLPQLQAALPKAQEAQLVRFAAIKEPEATFIPSPGLRRVKALTPVAGLVLAGAHTATGWPATMESAVRSGLSASETLALDWQAAEPALQTQGR